VTTKARSRKWSCTLIYRRSLS